MVKRKVVVAGALGECVHVAGVMNFLRLAETGRLADGLPGAGGVGRAGDCGRTPTTARRWSASPIA